MLYWDLHYHSQGQLRHINLISSEIKSDICSIRIKSSKKKGRLTEGKGAQSRLVTGLSDLNFSTSLGRVSSRMEAGIHIEALGGRGSSV